jgi:hypothetical protein
MTAVTTPGFSGHIRLVVGQNCPENGEAGVTA